MRALTVTSKGAERAVSVTPEREFIDPNKPFPAFLAKEILNEVQRRERPEAAILDYLRLVDRESDFKIFERLPSSKNNSSGLIPLRLLKKEKPTKKEEQPKYNCSAPGCQGALGKTLNSSDTKGIIRSLGDQQLGEFAIFNQVSWDHVTAAEANKRGLAVSYVNGQRKIWPFVNLVTVQFIGLDYLDARTAQVLEQGNEIVFRFSHDTQAFAQESRLVALGLRGVSLAEGKKSVTGAEALERESLALMKQAIELQIFSLRGLLVGELKRAEEGTPGLSAGELMLLASATERIALVPDPRDRRDLCFYSPLLDVLGGESLREILAWDYERFNPADLPSRLESLGSLARKVKTRKEELKAKF